MTVYANSQIKNLTNGARSASGCKILKKKMQGQEVLALTKWNTTRTMFNRKLLSLAHNSYYDQSPAALQSLFTESSPVYNLRRKMIFSLPKPSSDILKKSISYQAATLWNSLDSSTRAADSLPSFRKLIIMS